MYEWKNYQRNEDVNSLWVWQPEGVLQHGKADGADELLVHLAHEPRLLVAHPSRISAGKYLALHLCNSSSRLCSGDTRAFGFFLTGRH